MHYSAFVRCKSKLLDFRPLENLLRQVWIFLHVQSLPTVVYNLASRSEICGLACSSMPQSTQMIELIDYIFSYKYVSQTQ